MIGRIVIDDLRPRTPSGAFPAKAVVGEAVRVSADVFRDGHDLLAARVRWRRTGEEEWGEAPMHELGNDRWEAVVRPAAMGDHELVVEAWTDEWATWRHKVQAKLGAGQEVEVELEEGARLLERRAGLVGDGGGADGPKAALLAAAEAARRGQSPLPDRLAPLLSDRATRLMAGPAGARDLTSSPPLSLWVDRPLALCGAWYEFFPRSEGGLKGAAERLRAVADMGFDVVYLPPIHPIGRSWRKGRNNTLAAGPGDPGSPWAIGGPEGGHTEIHPELGTLEDFRSLLERASQLGLEVALDYALQCSPDHPWVKDHPEWFNHRPDGSIAYAENPPKKYQDIVPINFWPEKEADRKALWEACRQVLVTWIERGVRIFRVDNPHTKPFAFWAWLLPSLKASYPELVFLSEAFTRPKVMAKLAEVGFSQSYTYFTWRTTSGELRQYLEELTSPPLADYLRPNFWPNTPDILSGPLRRGPRPAFKMRLVLAATLVPSYGIYSGYELEENEPASEANEEYAWSEKYEIKHRDWSRPDTLAPFITLVNQVRRRHPAFSMLRNLVFHDANNPAILAYSRHTDDRSDVVLVVVNLDPWNTQEATLGLDLGRLGLPWDRLYLASDEVSGQVFEWYGPNPYVRLDPWQEPAHILSLRTP